MKHEIPNNLWKHLLFSYITKKNLEEQKMEAIKELCQHFAKKMTQSEINVKNMAFHLGLINDAENFELVGVGIEFLEPTNFRFNYWTLKSWNFPVHQRNRDTLKELLLEVAAWIQSACESILNETAKNDEKDIETSYHFKIAPKTGEIEQVEINYDKARQISFSSTSKATVYDIVDSKDDHYCAKTWVENSDNQSKKKKKKHEKQLTFLKPFCFSSW